MGAARLRLRRPFSVWRRPNAGQQDPLRQGVVQAWLDIRRPRPGGRRRGLPCPIHRGTEGRGGRVL